MFLALLIPPLLLCAVLGLGRYEERMLGPAASAAAPPRQGAGPPHPVPDAPTDRGASGAPKPALPRGRHRRHPAAPSAAPAAAP
ncbi:hypothetical protein AB0E73_33440, partial [Streptomyces sp. NPDC031705]